ncbi:MAG TPA: hypothetical protein VGL35_01425 [Rhizomicrobium sp.]
MGKTITAVDIEDRLVLAEQAIAEAAARIAELTRAVSEMARVGRPPDLAKVRPIVIGADFISPFTVGFYDREFDAADRPYRWTGRGTMFELRLQIDRNPEWDFAMELQKNPHVDISRLRAYLDYIEIPIKASGSDALVRGTIPQKPFCNSATLTFRLPNVFVPKEVNADSPDTRTLGLVFYGFHAVPKLVEDTVCSSMGANGSTGITERRGEATDPMLAAAGADPSIAERLPRKRQGGFAARLTTIKG